MDNHISSILICTINTSKFLEMKISEEVVKGVGQKKNRNSGQYGLGAIAKSLQERLKGDLGWLW
jgi:hypothetical protein